MASRKPMASLATHEVTNQPPPLEDYNLYELDPVIQQALAREGAGWAADQARALGGELGSTQVIEWGRLANTHLPELRTFDRFGHRIDEVEFHPAYHELMALAMRHGLPTVAWTAPQPGGHVVHTALTYLFIQIEQGVACPMAMTYAAIPPLRAQPEVAAEWEPRILAGTYDPRCIPAPEKAGVTIGMAMTEKQGGSDVRTNSTRAVALDGGGPGAAYELTGHKWFCSAPMCDGFLTLANTDKGQSCFFVPRWRPDGTRNPFLIQRLKDKLGNRSNASSEVEYHGTWAQMVGEEGRGVRTILDMVQHTRLDTSVAPAGMMRQALLQAAHHTAHRSAFANLLFRQPLMRNVLADLALEVEAATTLVMRIARAFDEAAGDESARALARIGIAIAKFWNNKRAPGQIYEAMECLGGAGYVEESPLPRLFRESPLNSIWEGSGNVICLDVLRAMRREPLTTAVFLEEVTRARGADRRLDGAIERLKALLGGTDDQELRARQLTEQMALTLQGSLLVQHAPAAVADAFCASRLDPERGFSYGTLPPDVQFDAILQRALPHLG
ncbi:MAG: acyl-CoA dehydrogenase family protein [Candidatus Lambdaproteobacteria bacterium]|nr:acyl-CoA dehydrogenase family protein [Candidatus Lambdaproteobacteria bacterium]